MEAKPEPFMKRLKIKIVSLFKRSKAEPKKPREPFKVIVKTAISETFKEWKLSFSDPRFKVRKMGYLLTLSFVGALAAFGGLGKALMSGRGAKTVVAEETHSDPHGKKIEKHSTAMFSLGTFLTEIKIPTRDPASTAPSEIPYAKGSLAHVAEMELVIECDEPETCKFVEDHIEQARNQVTSALMPLTQDDLLSKDGKKVLKQAIMTSVNKWLESGTVKNIHFVRFIIT